MKIPGTQVNEEYITSKNLCSCNLEPLFLRRSDPAVKSSKSLKDVEPELENLRQKAISKVYDFIVQKLIALRKPKTNIQILQQSVILKYKYIISFLKEHGKEVFLDEIDQPALIPHIAEASSLKYPYEVLFRSLHKLLMDTATSEYIFCDDFVGEESIFYEIFAAYHVTPEDSMLRFLSGQDFRYKFLDAAIADFLRFHSPRTKRILQFGQVNISLWPRFKMVFDSHISSLRDANIKTLWEDDVHPHYVMRRYAEFTASFIHLNVEYGDGQLDINLERLRMAVDVLILKLAKLFPRPKQQIVFLINNYDMNCCTEAGPEGGKTQMHFKELLKSNTSLFVEELLVEHFSDLIIFVKSRASEDSSSNPERSITVAEVDPLVKDFGSRWKTAIELMHKRYHNLLQ
ncbi:hypothetical protein Bca101_056707 [Brassica carinata]